MDLALWPGGLVEIGVKAAQHAMVDCPLQSLLEAHRTPVRLPGQSGQLVLSEDAVGREGVGQAVGCLSQQRLVSPLWRWCAHGNSGLGWRG